jgi:cysteine desulfurase / selenocysteine lyase
MTIAELQSNEALRLQEFPVAKEKVFLAHAGVCPLPRRVAEKIREYASACTLGDQETLGPAFQMERTRALAARLLNAKSEEIAFVGPTSLGLSYVAAGMQFKRHDNVVIYLDDYPSNVYPWMALTNRGVQVRFITTRDLGCVTPIDVERQMDENTRLVALASCHFLTGWRIDLQGIGKMLRRRQVWFCVDGIQTVGAFPTTVENIDFLAADSHKWMLGPCAAGLLYVRKELQDYLRPAMYGWNNVHCPDFITQEKIVLRDDARRYEAGSTNLLGLVGLHAAMELLLEVGIDNISAELLRKRAWLVPVLREKGYQVLCGDVPEPRASGIISCLKPGANMEELHQRLLGKNIAASLRSDRAGNKYLRLSAHFYTTDAELNRLVELL